MRLSSPRLSSHIESPRLSSHIELSSRCAAPSAVRRVDPCPPWAPGGWRRPTSPRGPRAGWEEACQAQLPDQEDLRRHHHAANALGKYREPLRLPGRAWLGRAVSGTRPRWMVRPDPLVRFTLPLVRPIPPWQLHRTPSTPRR